MVPTGSLFAAAFRMPLLLLAAGVAAQAFGESLISQIGWKGADRSAIAAIVAILVSGVSVLLVLHMRTSLRRRTDESELSDNLFAEGAQKAELNRVESEHLRTLAAHAHIQTPHIVFQSIAVFERCIDVQVRSLLASSITPGQQQEEEMVLSNLRKKLGYSFLALEHPLVSTRNISIGQRLSVFAMGNQHAVIQHARVVQNKEFSFSIQYDIEKEEFFRVNPGMELRLAFARQNDGVYGITSKVIGANGAGSIDFLHTLEFKRNQLRQFVRIEVTLPLRYRLLRTDIEENKPLLNRAIEAKITDISGGGLSFICEKPLAPGDIVSLTFQLPSVAVGAASAKVLRVSLQEGKTATYYKHHVQFQSIEQRVRDKIVRFVFEKQRQLSQWR